MLSSADETKASYNGAIEKSTSNPHANRIAIHTDTYDIDEDALGTNLPKNYYTSPGFIGTVIALSLGNISGLLGWVMPSNTLSLINEDIGPSPNITWVVLANTLGVSVGSLVVGRLSDIFGRRWFFIGGNGLALIGAVIAATATSVESIIGGNILGGLATAAQVTFVAAIAELVPNKHRPIWVAALILPSFEISCFGPVIAQTLVTNTKAGWRWSFYLDIIVAGLAILLLFFFYHPPDFRLLHKNRSRMEQLKRINFVGLFLFSGGLVLFLIGISWGGGVYPWNSAHVIATIIVGAVALIIFVIYDSYVHSSDTLVPLRLFKSGGYFTMVVTAAVGACVYISMNVLWPQQIAYLFPGTATHNGWLACVVGSSALLGVAVGGVLCQSVSKSRWILIGSCVSLAASSASMISLRPGDEARGIGLMFMACFSSGVIEICSLSLAPLTCASEDLGTALGVLGTIRSIASSVAVAAYSTILSNKLTELVPEYVTVAALAAGLPSSSLADLFKNLATGTLSKTPGINATIVAAVTVANSNAAADSFKYVWFAIIVFAAFAVLVACFTIDYGVYLTDEVMRKMHGSMVQMRIFHNS